MKTPSRVAADLQGAARLATEGSLALVRLVEAMHARIQRPLPGPANERTRGLTGLVYRGVHGVTRGVGMSTTALLGLLPEAVERGPRSPRRDAVVAALNGVLGDHLAATGNPLAQRMQLCCDGEPLVLTRGALAARFPSASQGVLVLLHGLCMNDRQWRRKGHDHGAELGAALGLTPLYLRYNSGLPVTENGRQFAALMATLLRVWPHAAPRVVLLAHSMGGLVARTALAGLGPEVPAPRLFVSISTPWGGEPGAELGVRHSPAVVPSWHDMRPEGPFMAALFNRPLPATTEHVLLFGHKGGYSLMRPNTDGTVTLASQLRPEAQAGARRVLGFDEDHMSILSSPQLAQVLASVLDAALQPAPGGQGQLQLALRSPPGLAVGTPNLRLKPVDGGPALTLVLSDADRTRAVGPVPPGRYEAGLLASGFASVPQRQVVDVAAGTTVPLSFELVPDGTLAGYIGDARAQPQVAAGVRVLPHETVRVRRIRLQGAGLVRELTPRDGGSYDQALERMIDGRDDATRSQFAFVRLPAGDYELLIEADGHLSHRSRHRVLPGVQGPLTPVLLQPLPRP